MPSLSPFYSLLPFLFVVLLMLQGISIFTRSGGTSLPKYLATLSILMAAAILLTASLTFADSLIFSPEFLVLIGYGWFGVASLAMLLSVGAGIGWHAALRYIGYPSRLWVLFLTGFGIGLIVLWRNQFSISAGYDSRLPVFAYELGWLPWNLWLLGWIAAPVLPNLNVRHVWQTAFQQWTTERWQGKMRFILSYAVLLSSLFFIGWTLLNLLVGGKFDPVIAGRPDVFVWGAIDGSLYALGLILSWFICMEFAVQVGLHDVSSAIIPIVTPLLMVVQRVNRWVMDVGATTLASAKAMTEVNSVWSLVGKVLIGIIVLIGINELPNVGKTVIVPFQTEVLTTEKEQAKTLGRMIAERVINRLGILKGLEADVVSQVAGMNQKGQNKWSAQYTTSISTTDALTAALSKSQDIQIGGIPIPLTALVAPIQTPIRFLLGVREVSGSLQMADVNGKKNYTLLATATTGETWRMTHRTEIEEAKPKGCSDDASRSDELDDLADQVAFHILATDATLRALGITESVEAYRLYTFGMACLKRFTDSQRYGHLTKAIENFRKALQEDPNFALAYFRLGNALWRDGQAELAAAELRKAIKLTEKFYAGTILLASLLQQVDTPTAISVPMKRPQIDEKAEDVHREEAKTYWLQAVSAPRKDVGRMDLAAAYLALCQDVLNPFAVELRDKYMTEKLKNIYVEEGMNNKYLTEEMRDKHLTEEMREKYLAEETRSKYLAYFFCRNSINFSLYYPSSIFGQTFSATGRQEFRVQTNEVLAYALQTLGELLMHPGENPIKPDRLWHCRDIDLVTPPNMGRSFYPRKAMAYYETARAVVPSDPTLKCYAAAAAYVLNDPEPMRHLRYESEVHVVLAEAYRLQASNFLNAADAAYSDALDEDLETLNGLSRNDTEFHIKQAGDYILRASKAADTADWYYSHALDEYQEALDNDARSFDALNGFAYTMWEWRFKAGVRKAQEPYFPYAVLYAERAIVRAEHMPGDEELLALSTLGELLLAEGSFDGARQHLEKAYHFLQHPGKDHPNYDSVRWDFAQALLCSSDKYLNFAKGETLLKEIRTNENSRESKRFNEDDLKVGCALPLVKLGIKQGRVRSNIHGTS